MRVLHNVYYVQPIVSVSCSLIIRSYYNVFFLAGFIKCNADAVTNDYIYHSFTFPHDCLNVIIAIVP